MAGYAYRQDDDLEHEHGRDDALDAPQQARAGGGSTQQSLAEISQLYPDDAGGLLDLDAQMCVAPEVDQLALHGAEPEASRVDPAAAAVAQAELETRPTTATAQEEDAQPASDAGGPEAGTVQPHNTPANDAPAHGDLPAAPEAALAGAATGLTTAIAETPAAPGKETAEAGSPPPAAPSEAPAAKPGATWEDRARAYNQRHGLIEAFNTATSNTCGTGHDADPRAVAGWQKTHGVHPDGRIGHVTLDAATKQAPKPDGAKDAAARAESKIETSSATKIEATPDAKPEVKAQAEAQAEVKTEASTEAKKPAAPVAKPIAPTRPAIAPAPVTPAVELAPPVGEADSFIGAEDVRGKAKDRWAGYGKGDQRTHGWDIGGSHGAKHSGGDVSAAIYAVAHVEGRYDSVQTYDAGILSFGIMQWTLHAGSLQKFLGFLKDQSGPEGRAAFQQLFVARGIDVAKDGSQYQLVYNGKSYPLGAKGAGKAEIDKLVREEPKVARTWAEVFHAAGADPRVQKAQFERAKEMFHEAEGVRFNERVVEQSLDACKRTFHARYRTQYGKAQSWMTASPKAAALYFSMRINNPTYANAAFLKAIDAFYDAHGTDSTKWPETWGGAFGDLVAAKSAETLTSWGTEGKDEGRVDKTLRFWNKVHGKGASAPAAQAKQAPPAAEIASKQHKPGKDAAPDPALEKKLRGQYAGLLKLFVRGQIDQAEAVRKLVAYDQKLHGGQSSVAGLVLLPAFLTELIKLTVAKATANAPAQSKPRAEPPPTQTPAVAQTPAPKTQTPAPKTQTTAPRTPANVDAAPPHVEGKAISKILKLPRPLPQVHAFLPPGGVKGNAEVFLFLHGMFAHHDRPGAKINDPNPDKAMNLAGAMAATRRNLVTLAPVAHFDGEWPLWNELAKNNGFQELIVQSLDQLSTALSINPPLSIGSISLAGHSAGGSGLGAAAEQYGDKLHDVTYEDAGYADKPKRGHGWKDSHDKVAAWLLGGASDKRLRVLLHGKDNYSEARILHSHFNKEALEDIAHTLKKDGVQVTREDGDHDARTADKGMYLDHTLHVHGLPGLRTVTVFNMPKANHMQVRNRATQHLITEGRDTEFETDAVAPTGAIQDAGELPAAKTEPKAPAKPEPKPEAKTEAKTEAKAEPKAEPKARTEPKAKKPDHPAADAASGPVQAVHPKRGYDRDDKTNLDSFGNPTERVKRTDKNLTTDHKRVFTNQFTTTGKAPLLNEKLKDANRALAKGTVLHTHAVNGKHAQVVTEDITLADNLWISFKYLGGNGSTQPDFGNEQEDAQDKERADAIRDRLPKTGRTPGASKHTWKFSSVFLPSAEGIALDGSLMAKVNALMEWAVAEDMITGDIVIRSGVRPPITAHKLCIRFQLAHRDGKGVDFDAIRALPDGMYHGWKFCPEPGKSSNEAIKKQAHVLYEEKGGSGAQAAAGFAPGATGRSPLTDRAPGVSKHCPGHAIDIQIPWRSPKDPKATDLWAWEEIYHQFGLTRPLHRDRGFQGRDAEHWHIEETGKQIAGAENDGGD